MALLRDARSFYEKLTCCSCKNVRPGVKPIIRQGPHWPTWKSGPADGLPTFPHPGAGRREPAPAAECKRLSIIAKRMSDDALLAESSKRCATARNAGRSIWSQAVLRELHVS